MDREFIGSCRRWTFQSFVFSPLYTRNPFDMYTGSADFLQESQFQTGGIFAAVRSGHVQTLCCLSFIIPRVCAFAIITTLWSLVYTRARTVLHWASALASSLIISRSEGRESVVSLISLLCSVVALIYFCRCGPLDHPVPAVRSQRRLVGLRRPSLRNAGRTAAVRRRGWRGTLCRHHRPERLLSEITVQRSQRDLQRS